MIKIFLFSIFFLFSTHLIANEQMSYALVELESKKLVSKKNENKPQILASVSKIFSSYYALSILGTEYRFKTTVHTVGEIKDGILQGDLYLVGHGAPYLTSQHFISLIHQIQNKGIKKVLGNFYLDDTALANSTQISNLGLQDQADNPSIGALNVEFNRISLKRGFQKPNPPLDYIQFKKSNSSNNGQKFSFLSSNSNNVLWQINQKERLFAKESIPSKDSSLFSGYFFRYLANIHGLSLKSPQRKILPENNKEIALNKGVPLSRLISLGLEYSNNLIAETLLKMSAKKETGKVLTIEQSSKQMLSWLKKKHPNLDWKALTIENGSGLTVVNKTSAKFMANFLVEVNQSSFQGRSFWSFLSINGHSGGLKRRLEQPDNLYRVYGKTGTIFYVTNLAGYIITNSNKQYAFALFKNHDKNREILNGKNSPKLNQLRKNSRAWSSKAISEQDQKLNQWLKKF